MTIYEADEFERIWDYDCIKFNRSVDKLRDMRRKIAADEIKKLEDGIPTSFELECWLSK